MHLYYTYIYTANLEARELEFTNQTPRETFQSRIIPKTIRKHLIGLVTLQSETQFCQSSKRQFDVTNLFLGPEPYYTSTNTDYFRCSQMSGWKSEEGAKYR